MENEIFEMKYGIVKVVQYFKERNFRVVILLVIFLTFCPDLISRNDYW